MRFPALLALAAALLPAAAAAQTVHGELVERGGGRPIAAALVILLDEAGARRGAALTDSAGRFVLHVPGAGTWRLRAERVGFRSTLSPPLTLGVDETRAYRMESDPAAVSLAGITARSGRRCRPHPGSGPATATLWEEVRKALTAAEHVARSRLLRYDLETYARHMEPDSLTVLHDARERHAGEWQAPFFSTPVDSLSREGFVRAVGDSVAFDAPDAHVLLSDRFLADHCFHVEEDAARPDLVGLAFEPVEERSRIREVAGVLWLERGTARLQRLRYRYVNVPYAISATGAGGEAEFERLAGGQWIVRRWWILMPQYVEVPRDTVAAVGRTPRFRRAVAHRLAWLREEGGEVSAASVPLTGAAPRSGRVAGTAWDSLNARPLAGATVLLSGTRWATVADSAGRFAIDGVPAGRYLASYAHPELAGWGAEPEPRIVKVEAGSEASVALATLSPATLAARHCPPETRAAAPGVVVGLVTRGGQPQPSAQVMITWTELEVRRGRIGLPGAGTVADDHGFYAVCGVDPAVALTLEANSGPAIFRESIHMGGTRVLRHDVRMEASPPAEGGTETRP